MFTYLELGVVLALLPFCYATIDSVDCESGMTSLDGGCYYPCENVTRNTACDCFGDICYDSGWCRDDQTCCRTCETNWNLLGAVLGVIILGIIASVLHGELFTKSNKMPAEFEVTEEKLVMLEDKPRIEPQSKLPEVVRIGAKEQTTLCSKCGKDEISHSVIVELSNVKSRDSDQDSN